MHFTQDGVPRFLEIFNEHQEAIRQMPGCLHMELMRDLEDPGHFLTLSHWDSADSLEDYRRSPLFRSIWPSVKTLFSERSRAYSVQPFKPDLPLA